MRGHVRLTTPFSGATIRPFAKTIENVVSGLKERVYYIDDKGTIKPECFRSGGDLYGLVDDVAVQVGSSNRVTSAEFIASRAGSKRHMYERARQDLYMNPTTLSNLAKLGFFTKYENTMWEKKQVPRIISPRDPRFNLLLGRYTTVVEHKIFDGLQACLESPGPVVAKGLTQQQKGQLIASKLQPGWAAVGLDASRFDQTIGRELLLVEHRLYKALFPGDKLLSKLLKCQLTNFGVARCRDGSVSANIGPMRCSGDQNTSLGNCIISVLLAKLYANEHNISHFDVLCDGDDLIMFVPQCCLPLLDDLSDWYLEWGLRMKIETPAFVPEEVEFCQSKPVWTELGYILVRNPRKVLNTAFAGGCHLLDDRMYQIHMRNVGLCGLSTAAGVPILQAYFGWAVDNGITGKFDYRDLAGYGHQYRIQLAAGHRAVRAEVHPATRASFALAYGLSEHEQLDIEEAIASMAYSRRFNQSVDRDLIPHKLFSFVDCSCCL